MIEKKEKHTYKNVIETKKIEEDECGEGVRYEIYENGGMIIEGNGSTGDYNDTDPGWHSKKESIKEIIITNGVSLLLEIGVFNNVQI